MLDKGKDAVIAMVSMKLKQFNKPFLLAILIGGLQLPLLIIIFVALGSDCLQQTILSADAPSMMMEYAKLGRPCIEKAFALWLPTDASVADALSYDEPIPVQSYIQMHECKLGGGDGRYLDSINFCSQDFKDRQSNPAIFNEHDGIGCPWNPSTNCAGLADDLQATIDNNQLITLQGGEEAVPKSVITQYPECLAHTASLNGGAKDSPDLKQYLEVDPWLLQTGGHSGKATGNPWGQQLLYFQVCPSSSAVLAMTLGYAGFIELGLTAVVVGTLWALKIVKLKNAEMDIKTWMKEYHKEETKEK